MKTLVKENILPRIITGTSAGSILATFASADNEYIKSKCDEPGFMKYEHLKKDDDRLIPKALRRFKRIITKGLVLNIEVKKIYKNYYLILILYVLC
jgi:predicted acylesterase/phospholipase RssA